eukprot:1184339-Prorocentrum_minimum.AAC.2
MNRLALPDPVPAHLVRAGRVVWPRRIPYQHILFARDEAVAWGRIPLLLDTKGDSDVDNFFQYQKVRGRDDVRRAGWIHGRAGWIHGRAGWIHGRAGGWTLVARGLTRLSCLHTDTLCSTIAQCVATSFRRGVAVKITPHLRSDCGGAVVLDSAANRENAHPGRAYVRHTTTSSKRPSAGSAAPDARLMPSPPHNRLHPTAAEV